MDLLVDDFLCNICLQALEDPVNDPCGHSFCKECITNWHKTTQNCPVSKMYFGPERLNPNRLVKLVMEAHLTKCDNAANGCSWLGKFRDYEKSHRLNCKMKEFPQASLKSFMELLKDPAVKIYRFEMEHGEVAGLQKDGELNFAGTIQYKNGDHYEGNLQENKRHGAGRFRSVSDNTTTEGYWQDDLKNGFACIFKDKIIVFEGFFLNDHPDGDCVIRVESGVIRAKFAQGVIDGEAEILFKNGGEYTGLINAEYLPHGRGSLMQFDGSMTLAEYSNGEPVGELEIVYANGNNFKGTFDKESGTYTGEMKYANKHVYTGTLKNGKKQGKGKFVKDKEIYEGDFLDDKMHGDIKISFGDNSFFEGKFENDLARGPAKKTFSNGIIVEGTCDGWYTISGQGIVKLVDGTKIEGMISSGHSVYGKGKITLPNGNVVTGNIDQNKISGKGEIVYSDGANYKGDLKHNYPEGKGTLTKPNEGTYIGDFVNGSLNGRIEFKPFNGPKEFAMFKMGKRTDPIKIQKPSTAKLLDSKDQVPVPKPPVRPKTEHKEIKKERVATEGNEKVKMIRPTMGKTPRWS